MKRRSVEGLFQHPQAITLTINFALCSEHRFAKYREKN
jgi:hypothetical protein